MPDSPDRPALPTLTLSNTYAELSDDFYTPEVPTPVSDPQSIALNDALADFLTIDRQWFHGPEALEVFAGNRIHQSSQPIAMAYGGHQFGMWNPTLGDGRALLLGEIQGRDGNVYDIHLKGSGPTRYSRGGDGRSPVGPVLREYLISETMHQLGVPTSRSLAAIATGDPVYRETVLPGAVLTRVARSHIRIGTFQLMLARGEPEAIRCLADFTIKRLYPELIAAKNPYLGLLAAVVDRQAALIAKWQALGFIHGVMNTDNMLVSGETIDYGPCAFMDGYMAKTCYSSIDRQGRYDFRNQASIAHWNLTWLAQSLIGLIDQDEQQATALAQEAINQFPELYDRYYGKEICGKLGLEFNKENASLASELLNLMAEQHSDYTLSFRHLADLANTGGKQVPVPFSLPPSFQSWIDRWLQRLRDVSADTNALYRRNPAFIPRNHLVNAAIESAEQRGDYSNFLQLLEVLSNPFNYSSERDRFASPPTSDQVVEATFCGT
ncbi:MAG: protein adenylyltransferase SelO [bacterium]